MQKGQSLIEVIVALSVSVVVVASITIAVLSALTNAEFIKTQSLATQYATQAVETTRSIRNNNYALFQSLSGQYCMAKTCTTLNNTAGNACGPKAGINCNQNVDTYVREVDISPVNPAATDCNKVGVKVNAKVFWADSKCSQQNLFCHSVVLTTCFSDYQIIPTP